MVKRNRAKKTTANDTIDFTNGLDVEYTKHRKLDTVDEEGLTPFLDVLSFKKLSVGMKALGIVHRVNANDIMINLPNHLIGYVPMTEVSDALTERVAQVFAHTTTTTTEEEEEKTIEELSLLPKWNEWFKPGQVVLTQITGLEAGTVGRSIPPRKGKEAAMKAGHNRIELSLKPSRLNCDIESALLYPGFFLCAEVESNEDHGYLLKFKNGKSGLKGFLAKEKSLVEQYVTGQLIYVVVEGVQSSGIVLVTQLIHKKQETKEPQCEKLNTQTAPESKFDQWSFQTLYPGMLVNCSIKRTIPGKGLLVSFFNTAFIGSVDIVHAYSLMRSTRTEDEKEETQCSTSPIWARILFVESESRHVGLTFLPHLVHAKFQLDLSGCSYYKTGDFVKECLKVAAVHSTNGLLLRSTTNEKTVCFYIACHRLVDSSKNSSNGDKNERKTLLAGFSVGQSIPTARVVDIDYNDFLVHVSIQPSVLARPFIGFEDIQVGQMVRGQVTKLAEYGALVELSEHVRGLCPLFHWNELPYKTHPDFASAPFLVGQKAYKFRVLSVDPQNRKCILTRKPTLMDSPYSILSSLGQVHVGFVTHGFVISIKEQAGAVLSFYNSVTAYLPKSEISASSFVERVTDMLHVGQVVLARVTQVQPEENKCRVSLILDKEGKTNVPEIPRVKAEKKTKIPKKQKADDSQENTILSNKKWEKVGMELISAIQDSDSLLNVTEKGSNVANPSSLGVSEVMFEDTTTTTTTTTSVEERDETKQNNKKRILKRARLEDEKKIANFEKEYTSNSHLLNSISDYEQLLVTRPGDASLWIQFMAWTLSSLEGKRTEDKVEESRKIAKRAISQIPYREEKEKLAVWMAWLQMEWNVYVGGLPKIPASNTPVLFEHTLKEAVVCSDAKPIYLFVHEMMTRSYFDSSLALALKPSVQERLVAMEKELLARWKASCKVWLLLWNLQVHAGRLDVANETCAKALGSLPTRKHVKWTKTIALQEYALSYDSATCGSKGKTNVYPTVSPLQLLPLREQGRTHFESLITNAPKRSDIWILYLQAEKKVVQSTTGPSQTTSPHYLRRLFERVTSLSFPPKVMKTLFKMYLTFETANGTTSTVEHVKTLAKHYVEKMASSSSLLAHSSS